MAWSAEKFGRLKLNGQLSGYSPLSRLEELEILALVAEGKSNKQIGAELFLAVQTVKFHLTSLYRKLDASTRTEAVRAAYRQGLLEAPLLERVS